MKRENLVHMRAHKIHFQRNRRYLHQLPCAIVYRQAETTLNCLQTRDLDHTHTRVRSLQTLSEERLFEFWEQEIKIVRARLPWLTFVVRLLTKKR